MMDPFKDRGDLGHSRRRRGHVTRTLIVHLIWSSCALAETCVSPAPPYVPTDLRAMSDYADVIRQDFELYFQDLQTYFVCLDAEHMRAFDEGRDVTEAYERFLEGVDAD